MIRSMTGFGEASAHADGMHFFLELRSLNAKYFKAVIRLPEEFQVFEAELESRLRNTLRRGSVVLSLKVSDKSATAAFDINTSALSRYVEQIQQCEHVGSGTVPLDLAALLALPGVLQPPGDEQARIDAARAVVHKLCDEAAKHLILMRKREGVSLVDDLMAQRQTIADRLTVIEGRAPEVISEYEARIRSRIESTLNDLGVSAEPADIVKEVALAAERADVSEEITRLSTHIDQFAEMLSSDEDRPVGRTLDFLAQEMLREANTIGSKCGDAEIARAIVEVKGAIDRIKEQVQNVE